MSKIEWTDRTWNPWWGCGKIARECDHCYAATFAGRDLHPQFKGVAKAGEWTGRIIANSETAINAPLTWHKRCRVFTCSMSDFWHEDVPLPLLDRALDIIEATAHITYQILTKRPGNTARKLAALNRRLSANIWLGATVGHLDSLPLLKPLLRIECKIHFLSCEPLLTSLSGLRLNDIGWVIGGGESGHGTRLTDPDWMRDRRDNSVDRGVPFFLKQWGNWPSNLTPRNLELDLNAKGGATLNGRLWRDFPA